ncbi:chondroitinase-B domain-containing protein [Paraflavitalea sp. CAU 1676]|uniref:chondroitinase-B domain-containing protein n=1 Tax=Paraflavitalea sp. CAU 1676 TaxID=3032598 RepID=UPI0023DCB9DD|nr:chondroitinase-B domain-containing protein [Paraflavitalea sp. CAU 1676]MDF2192933.1 chondroitinase-B domain-containing protein [Paraflavitalea sp. CAU 1676]
MQELKAALGKAVPGDSILLKSGEWKDVPLIIESGGTSDRPLFVGAEEAGKVKFTGNSFVRFGADHITVSGIHFTNGFTKERAVVEFRNKEQQLANHCRLTQCAIENYSRPERFNTDHWIIFWGQHNRVDHCVIGDKLNSGTTLIVELNDERSQNNYHNIDSNYFKGHSPLGSNGGETIRVGVSRYSLTASRTLIHHNYFERCNGEVEIVSIKSGNNEIANNVFFECEGGLVLRHGSQNKVINNVFIGNSKPFTGGVRVINPGHIVKNNLFYKLAGERFHSGFSVLNGVPNSSISRYHQVKDVSIDSNTFYHCKSILFGAGKDPERTAAPVNVRFSNNLIVPDGAKLYEDANKDGGIHFANNVYGNSLAGKPERGFAAQKVLIVPDLHNRFKLSYIKSPVLGARLSYNELMDETKTGPSWCSVTDAVARQTVTHKVAVADSQRLPAAVQRAHPGDVIELTDGVQYGIEESIYINKPITIRAAAGLPEKPELVNVTGKSLPAFIIIEKGGSLIVENIRFNSADKSYGDVQSAISTTTAPMNGIYSLFVRNCEFFNFNESGYSCIRGTRSTYADSVVIENSVFRNNAGSSIDYSAEKEDKGIYNVEHLIIRNTLFTNTLSGAVNVYRGGNDESTTGPEVIIDHCTFNEVENRMQGCVIKLWGVQRAAITNSVFNNSGAGGRVIWFEEMSWDKLLVDYCNFYKSGRISSFYDKVSGKHNYSTNPVFINPTHFNFRLAKSTNLLSEKGKPLGVN